MLRIFLRNSLLEQMNKFYGDVDGGREWTVPNTSYCFPGKLMAATYFNMGYHRVLIKKNLSRKRVSGKT